MKSFFYALIGYFLTPPGLVLMAALDSSLVFFLPLGIDFAVIAVTARNPDLFWLYALLAAVGSVIGAGTTYWIGTKVGEHGLARLIKPSMLRRVQRRVSHGAAISVGALAVIPPPFPYTAFVLTSGAFHVNAWSLLTTIAAVRVVRFGIETALAARYGRQILVWMDSTSFRIVVGALIGLAIVGTIVSAVAVWRGARKGRTGGGDASAPSPQPF